MAIPIKKTSVLGSEVTKYVEKERKKTKKKQSTNDLPEIVKKFKIKMEEARKRGALL